MKAATKERIVSEKVFLDTKKVDLLSKNIIALNQLEKDFQQQHKILSYEQTIMLLEMKLDLKVPKDWVLKQDKKDQRILWFEFPIIEDNINTNIEEDTNGFNDNK